MKEHSQYPPNEFLYVNVVPSSFVTVLPSPPVVITLWGFPEPLPLPLELELPDEPELPEPDEDAALPEVTVPPDAAVLDDTNRVMSSLRPASSEPEG